MKMRSPWGERHGVQVLGVDDILDIRRSLLDVAAADDLASSGETFLLPVEDLLEGHARQFRIIYHDRKPADPLGQPITPHFGLVLDGTLSLAEYVKAETEFVQLLARVWELASGSAIVQVSYELSPDGDRGIAVSFDSGEQQCLRTLFDDLRRCAVDVIRVDDWRTLELLMKLGLREIAMNTFVFPTLGLALINHWDMRLLAFLASAISEELLTRVSGNTRLSTRAIDGR